MTAPTSAHTFSSGSASTESVWYGFGALGQASRAGLRRTCRPTSGSCAAQKSKEERGHACRLQGPTLIPFSPKSSSQPCPSAPLDLGREFVCTLEEGEDDPLLIPQQVCAPPLP